MALPIQLCVDDYGNETAAFHVPRSLNPNAALGAFGQELMYQWVTDTYRLLPAATGAQLIFRDVAPRTALQFPCLQNQILTAAAYHLSYLKPESRTAYRKQAFYHQSLAINDLKGRLSKGVTLDNSYALSMTSGILMLSTFAGYSDGVEAAPPLDCFCDITRQIRGMMSLGQLACQFHARPKGFFLLFTDIKHDFSGLTGITRQLAIFQRQLQTVTSFEEDIMETLIRCTQALAGFMYDDKRGRTIRTVELRISFAWPLVITDRYMELVKARNQGALTLLLFYCVIMQRAERGCWILEGWASRISKAASALISESPWTEFAQWPLQELDLIREEDRT